MSKKPEKTPIESPFYDIKQVAAYLQVAQRTVYLWVQAGKLPGFKIGSVWRFKKEDIDAMIEGAKEGSSDKACEEVSD